MTRTAGPVPDTCRRPRHDRATVLVVLVWAAVVVPRLVQSLTAPKYRATVGAPVPLSAPATYFDLSLVLAVGAWCTWIVLRSLHDLPTTRRRELLALLAPWVYLVARDLYVDHRPDRGALLYPVVVVALWVLRPRIEQLAVLGRLVGLTALISLGLGLLLPEKGIYTSVTGELIAPEKQILPGGVLIGVFTDSNNLAQFLVLGLPVVLMVPRRTTRALLGSAVLVAIVWTSSRSSIAAALLGLLTAALLATVPARSRRAVAITLPALVVTALVALPLLTTSDDAFTNRGYIWRNSLDAWSSHPVTGLGSQWFSEIAQFANGLGGFAYHGHNQLVQTLVTGGLVQAVLVGLLALAVGAAAGRWAERGVMLPAVHAVTLATSCCLEVSFGFVDREFLLAVAMLPVACALLAETWPAPLKP